MIRGNTQKKLAFSSTKIFLIRSACGECNSFLTQICILKKILHTHTHTRTILHILRYMKRLLTYCENGHRHCIVHAKL